MSSFRGLVVFAALALASGSARAAEPALPLKLDWQAPPECDSAEAIVAELARIAHVQPGRVPATLVARARIEKRAGRYRLSLKTERDGEHGERVLSSSECSALGREVTLVLALAFGEGVELTTAPSEGAAGEDAASPPPAAEKPVPPKPTPPPVKPPPEQPTAASARDPNRFRVALFAGGGVLWRALPAPAGLAFAGVELGSRRFWLAPRVQLVPRVSEALERGVRARFDTLGGGLAGCGATAAARFLFASCVTAAASAARGRSTGASVAESAVAPWYSAGISASAAFPEDFVIGVRLEAGLSVSLNRPRFVVDGLGEAHTIERFAPSLGLSMLVRP